MGAGGSLPPPRLISHRSCRSSDLAFTENETQASPFPRRVGGRRNAAPQTMRRGLEPMASFGHAGYLSPKTHPTRRRRPPCCIRTAIWPGDCPGFSARGPLSRSLCCEAASRLAAFCRRQEADWQRHHVSLERLRPRQHREAGAASLRRDIIGRFWPFWKGKKGEARHDNPLCEEMVKDPEEPLEAYVAAVKSTKFKKFTDNFMGVNRVTKEVSAGLTRRDAPRWWRIGAGWRRRPRRRG